MATGKVDSFLQLSSVLWERQPRFMSPSNCKPAVTLQTPAKQLAVSLAEAVGSLSILNAEGPAGIGFMFYWRNENRVLLPSSHRHGGMPGQPWSE